MENNNNNKKKKTLFAAYAILALVLVAGVTYAFITIVLQGTKENTITGGELTLEFDETANSDGDIMIADAFPMSDEAGKQSDKYYVFTLKNSSPKNATYTIYLDEEDITDPSVFGTSDPTESSNPESTPTVPLRLGNEYVKVYLTDDKDQIKMNWDTPKKVSDLAKPTDSRTVNGKVYDKEKTHVLYSNILEAATGENHETPTTATFRLRMWIASDAGEGMTDQDSLKEIMGRYYATKISVDAEQVKEFAVTIVNTYTEGEGPSQTETMSTAVYYNGNAVFTGLSAPTTENGQTPSVSCTKTGNVAASNGMEIGTVSEGKFNLTINDVMDHLTCTVTHTANVTP